MHSYALLSKQHTKAVLKKMDLPEELIIAQCICEHRIETTITLLRWIDLIYNLPLLLFLLA